MFPLKKIINFFFMPKCATPKCIHAKVRRAKVFYPKVPLTPKCPSCQSVLLCSYVKVVFMPMWHYVKVALTPKWSYAKMFTSKCSTPKYFTPKCLTAYKMTTIDVLKKKLQNISVFFFKLGGLMGHTFSHIICDQFKLLKDGDRFFFTHRVSSG